MKKRVFESSVQSVMKMFGQIMGLLMLLTALTTGVQAEERIVFYHNDLLGSPVAATDENGDVLWTEDYQPYGHRLRNEQQANLNRLWYTGKSHDDDTGLTYFGARYYDPVVGRFMAIDPAGALENIESNPMMFNRYAYANNNPYKFVDPDGRMSRPISTTPCAGDYCPNGFMKGGGGIGPKTGFRQSSDFKAPAQNGLAAKNNANVQNKEVPLINGRKPINSQYAGKTHPSGVKFDKNGFPDFSPYAKAKVDIKGLTGNYAKDSAMANKAVGLKSTPEGFVWHHVQNGRTMQLIPKDIHNAVRHTGGAAVLRSQK